ncbi:hypothetical protein BDV06DRAFT_223682 [Aspergillus oleicola]
MAAIDQPWENGIQSRARPADPQTPPAKNHKPRQLAFQNYSNFKPKSHLHEVKTVDIRVRIKLAEDIIKEDKKANHLYVFSSPEAKGFYKVGRGQKLTRPTTGQESCYPGHELHCYIECPNAELFERVVHAEFFWSRRKHRCNKCSKTHREWIEAPLQDILDSVAAWSLYAQWLHRCGIHIDQQQQTLLTPGLSDRADRWRNWALQTTMRWMDNPRCRMPPIFHETTSKDQYFADSVPGLSDSPGSTPGSEGINYPPTPSTPTPVPRGLVMNKHTGKQTNALWVPEEETWENANTKPTARALFIKHDQQPSDQGRTLLGAKGSGFHGSLTKERSKSNGDRPTESGPEATGDIQGPLDAEVDKKVREVLAKTLLEVQVTNAGPREGSGTIHLLSLESAKGLYRICCRRDNKDLPERKCSDNTTPFHDIPNYMAVKKLLLAEFGVPPPNRKCERCSKTHRDWIEVSEDNIRTSIEIWKEFMKVGCQDVHGHNCKLSKGPDRWRRWGRDKVAEMQKDKTAVEDVPTTHCVPEGKTNARFGRLGDMMGKPTVSTEQQAPGLIDIGIAAVRSVLNGLL